MNINDMSEEAQIAMVRINPLNIGDINDPSEEVQLAAVNKRGGVIAWIKNPSVDVTLQAIKSDPRAINLSNVYVSNELVEKCKNDIIIYLLKCLSNNEEGAWDKVARYIVNMLFKRGIHWSELDTIRKSLDADYLSESNIDWDNLDDETLIGYVKENPDNIKYIKNPSQEVQLAALRRKPQIIQFIAFPSEKFQLYVVRLSPGYIRYINEPTDNVIIEAFKKDNSILEEIPYPSEKVQMYAVSHFPLAIFDIQYPTDQVQIIAINKEGESILHIRNLKKSVIEKCKDSIIRRMLSNIHDGYISTVVSMIKILEKFYIEWKEIEIIKQSIEHDQK